MVRKDQASIAHRPRGFTLIEAAISTVVVGVMMAAALTSVAKTGLFRRISGEQQTACLLAEQLMSEILAKSYWDPAATSPTSIGASSAELSTGNRSLYDDVDDFNGWVACPPESADGTDLAIGNTWYRRVQVSFVHWSALNTPVSTDYGLKRIWIEVGRVRAGGNVTNANDRQAITTLAAVAGRGRGL